MRREASKVLVAICVPAVAMSLALPMLSACGRDGQDADTGSDVPVDVLVRGAEPGGMTAEWDDPDGDSHVSLGDDGKAFYKEDGEETSGMWLLSSPTEGEMMLSDGRSFQLQLDEDSDTLLVSDMSDGEGATPERYSRDDGDSKGSTS